MFAHFTQGSNNLAQSIRFYDALLAPLDITRRPSEDNSEIVCYQHPDKSAPRFFVVTPFNNNPATVGNGTMIAFSATSTTQVDNCYRSGIDNGGTNEGLPGPRPEYDEQYYGAYLRDPDGNKVHIVYRGTTA